MRSTLKTLYWGSQVNLVAWLAVASETHFQYASVLVGLGIAAILEHVAVRHLRPVIRQMSAPAT